MAAALDVLALVHRAILLFLLGGDRFAKSEV
jgi:hypothetical protein